MATTTTKKPYWEKLRDPRWQRKRLEVMERDGFACRSCGDSESTLNVHHGYYVKGREPWEYRDETLWTLCEECHEEIQELDLDLRFFLSNLDPLETREVHEIFRWMLERSDKLRRLGLMGPKIDLTIALACIESASRRGAHEAFDMLSWNLRREKSTHFSDGAGI